MKKRELKNLGIKNKKATKEALNSIRLARNRGEEIEDIRAMFRSIVESPKDYIDEPFYGELAKLIDLQQNHSVDYELQTDLDYNSWGEGIEEGALQQMENACSLPISRAAALMPDAHLGYGLPIGGVLATEGAVIPYAVGVDIACRVMVSVYDISGDDLSKWSEQLTNAIHRETNFGMGGEFSKPKQHGVMDRNWNITDLISKLKSKAWRQLGTSGSGNHFVEFGQLEVREDMAELAKGNYLALVSHSGSRGAGATIAGYYSRLARELHPGLPKHLQHLAWLDLDKEGAEYWEAMQLMGEYASANHHVIHRDIRDTLGFGLVFQVENHHNFAWKEEHFGSELVVHRKGATPAGLGELGYIPGSMTASGFLVEGLGNAASLLSCSHGAGRQMSRTKAKNTITRNALDKLLKKEGVTLLSAGLDESPHAYKDIEQVMNAQKSLVRILAEFKPKIVKMAPD